jgi:hypothetical protein
MNHAPRLLPRFGVAALGFLPVRRRTAANAYMISRGHLTESPILGVLEKNLPFHIVRVPVGETDVFQRLISHLKEHGYKVWGKSFTDTAGCIMQLMVLNEVFESKIKS